MKRSRAASTDSSGDDAGERHTRPRLEPVPEACAPPPRPQQQQQQQQLEQQQQQQEQQQQQQLQARAAAAVPLPPPPPARASAGAPSRAASAAAPVPPRAAAAAAAAPPPRVMAAPLPQETQETLLLCPHFFAAAAACGCVVKLLLIAPATAARPAAVHVFFGHNTLIKFVQAPVAPVDVGLVALVERMTALDAAGRRVLNVKAARDAFMLELIRIAREGGAKPWHNVREHKRRQPSTGGSKGEPPTWLDFVQDSAAIAAAAATPGGGAARATLDVLDRLAPPTPHDAITPAQLAAAGGSWALAQGWFAQRAAVRDARLARGLPV